MVCGGTQLFPPDAVGGPHGHGEANHFPGHRHCWVYDPQSRKFAEVASLNPQFDGRHLKPGAWVSPVFEQSPGVFAALTIDKLGAMNVVWLDTTAEPVGWNGPVAFGGRDLVPGAWVTPVFEQSPGVFAALTIGRRGTMNVVWLDMNVQPLRWQGPVSFGDNHLQPGGWVSHVFEQSPGVFAALTVDKRGVMNVVWLDTNVQPVGWQGPVGFGGRHLMPGAPISPVFEQAPGVFAALTVGRRGAMNVVWLEMNAQPVGWKGPVGFGDQHLVPGSHMSPVFEQAPGVFTALTVDQRGVMNVVWLDTNVQPVGWKGPVGFGGRHLVPGAPVSPVFEQSPGVFAALMVGKRGAMNVVWLDMNVEPIGWKGPVGFGDEHLVPGAHVSPTFKQSPGVFAALTVDQRGVMNVAWLDTNVQPVGWKGPVGFGGPHLVAGAPVSQVFEQSSGVFAALAAGRSGAMNVVWLDMNIEPVGWRGPVGFGALGGGRWYPTLVTLPSGELFVYAGHPRNDDSRHNPGTSERYDPITDSWALLTPTNGAGEGFPDLYPRLFLLPNGRVFSASALAGYSRCVHFDASTGSAAETVVLPDSHYHGFSAPAVMLPLLPNDGYRPRVLVCGGVTAQYVNLEPAAGTSPSWRSAGIRQGSAAGRIRRHACAVLLPTGQVLMTGGVEDPPSDEVGVNEPEIYTPPIDWVLPIVGPMNTRSAGIYLDIADSKQTGSWVTIEEPSPVVRNYHSTALLMPDGRVWTAGSSIKGAPGDPATQGQLKIAIFTPPYPAGRRPRLTKAPRNVGYGQPFEIETPDAVGIARIALIRCGSVTHAFDADQRYIGLSFMRVGRNKLQVQSPPTPSVAPPGEYMLFLIDRKGRPCIYAKFIRLHRS